MKRRARIAFPVDAVGCVKHRFYNCSQIENSFSWIIPKEIKSSSNRHDGSAHYLDPTGKTQEEMMDGSYSNQTKQEAIQVAASDRNAGLAQTIAQMYVATVPVLIQVMRDATAQGNLRDLFRAADALRLSSANIGAQRLADLCQNIRDLPSKDHLRNVPAQLNEIAQLAEKVCSVIQRNQTIVAQHEFA